MFPEYEYNKYYNKYINDKKVVNLAKKIYDFAKDSRECNQDEMIAAFIIALNMLKNE